MSILREEIAEQPAVLERLLDAEGDAVAAFATALRAAPPRFALIAARGSSDNVARYAQHVLGRLVPGAAADVVVLDDRTEVVRVLVDGGERVAR